MEELIDVLDENGNMTGEVLPKSEVKQKGLFHRAIAVCIINSKNEILMQKRSFKKKVYPNLWSIFVKGHISSGESPTEACKREIKEELGLDILEDRLEYLYTIKEEKVISSDYIERIFFDTYLLRMDVDLLKTTIELEELSEIKLVDIDIVKSLVKTKSRMLVPNQEDYERIFAYCSKKNSNVGK